MTNEKPEPGCYADSGNRGWKTGERAIEIAESYGWKCQEDESPLKNAEHEYHQELVDEATEWLNDNVPLENHLWGWNDGDWGLYPLEDDEYSNEDTDNDNE